MQEYIFNFVLKDKNSNNIIISNNYTLDQIMNTCIHDEIHEDLEKKYNNDCDCLNGSYNNCEYGPTFENYEIIAKRQYIRIKDCNDKKIFEDDIIEAKYGKDTIKIKGLIIFDKKRLSFEMAEVGTDILFSIKSLRNIEIIGNKFETPELLNAK